MRFLLFLALAAPLTACIAPKKVDELRASYDRQLARADSLSLAQATTMAARERKIERLEGARAALLEAQDRLEDKLVRQKDRIDDLSGNLNSTNARLQDRIARLAAELEEERLARDSLFLRTRALALNFQELADEAQKTVAQSLDSLIPPAAYTLRQNAGEMVLSVQEDVLFQPRSISRVKDESAYVLRALMDALQDDPLLKLTIVGHTDNRPTGRPGTDNWQFAALRATALADRMTRTYFLSPNRVIAASQGEFQPVASNADEDGRRANRRIDFILRGNVATLLRELGKIEK